MADLQRGARVRMHLPVTVASGVKVTARVLETIARRVHQ